MQFHRWFFASAAALVVLTAAGACAETLADAEVFVPTPRQQALADRVNAVAAGLRRSSDLRLRILYSMSPEEEVQRRPEDNGFYAREFISAASLYEQARGATDPVVLDLLLVRCGFATLTMKRCDRLDLARRWTGSDAQNQIAWLALAEVLRNRGEVDAAREAFERASLASQWHEHGNEVARLVARAFEADKLAPQDRSIALSEALSKSAGGSAWTAVETLSRYCKDPGALRTACSRLIDTMARDTDSIAALSIAAPFAWRARLDPLVAASYQQKADALVWALSLDGLEGDEFDDVDDATARQRGDRLQLVVERGSRRDAEQMLLAAHVTEADAASRYQANLSPAQRRQREERSAR